LKRATSCFASASLSGFFAFCATCISFLQVGGTRGVSKQPDIAAIRMVKGKEQVAAPFRDALKLRDADDASMQ
jgi:hypothetical protein